MTFSRKSSINLKTIWFSLLAAIVFAAACGNQNDAGNIANGNAARVSVPNSENSTVSNDDTAALGAEVLLPLVPEEVVWRAESVKNSDEKKLIAVMKFAEEDAKNLVALAAKHRPAEQLEVGAENWFPAELTAQTQLSGNEMLKGDAYAANDFLQLPYKSGKLIKVENSNYFILELSTN